MIKDFKLISKKSLTHNIYELDFETEENINFINWQFVTFLLEVWWRAYSILEKDWKRLRLVIRKREKDEWWRWWSKYLCELKIWDIIKWVWPWWHFILQNNNKNKLFLWTWTGFVPLYNQIIWWLYKKQECNFKFIFWIREIKDLFYIDILDNLKKDNSNFDYEVYQSRWEKTIYKKWYVSDFIDEKTLDNFTEVYLCWIHAMIDSSKEKLLEKWFDENNIFFEKY